MTDDRRTKAHHEPEARLFVAVPLPEAACEAIGGIVDAVRARLAAADEEAAGRGGAPGGRVRWVRMDGLHITLRFLGGTAEALVDQISAALDDAARDIAPFEVVIDGAGGFPSAGRPRALWLGIVDGADDLGHLARRFDGSLAAAGWPSEDRPFRAHLTLARTDGVRAGPLAARELTARAASLDLRFVADRAVLFRSHLGGGPARYEALHEARFGAVIAPRAAGR